MQRGSRQTFRSGLELKKAGRGGGRAHRRDPVGFCLLVLPRAPRCRLHGNQLKSEKNGNKAEEKRLTPSEKQIFKQMEKVFPGVAERAAGFVSAAASFRTSPSDAPLTRAAGGKETREEGGKERGSEIEEEDLVCRQPP